MEKLTQSTVWDFGGDRVLRRVGDMFNRSFVAEKLCVFSHLSKKFVVCGRAGRYLDIFDEEFNHLQTLKLERLRSDLSDYFVNIEVLEIGGAEYILTTSVAGFCFRIPLALALSGEVFTVGRPVNLYGCITFSRTVHNPRPSLIVGGKDRALTVMDCEEMEISWKSMRTSKIRHGMSYSSDMEKMRSTPIWFQDVVVDGEKFIVATRYGQLWIYHSELSRQPVDVITVCDNPIRHLHRIDNTLFIADAFNNVVLVHLLRLTVMSRFKLQIGPLGAMKIQKLRNGRHGETRFLVIATATVDRCLRIYLVEDGVCNCIASTPVTVRVTDLEIFDVDGLDTVAPLEELDGLPDHLDKRQRL
ncbi:unnamed protein product [Cyberlindnera jadinii]|uniref:Ribosome biogenesis protein NSA1 n=1 Tax=Cyberlindnera jadinii (strain ATCC 18201 / CBS 1600 / BCRC 20928 / JCM 3617 / NBRC 0987 / NRRL Y-1542) TaxID=983966 RepID=A0A0H5CGV6_CYBJN|nr:unnamed protein product [Cyberlindnera jadinii]